VILILTFMFKQHSHYIYIYIYIYMCVCVCVCVSVMCVAETYDVYDDNMPQLSADVCIDMQLCVCNVYG